MILVDDRTGSKELLPLIQKIGVKAELSRLTYGDAAFDGNGPRGSMAVGIERKTIPDILHCIDDKRYGSVQRPGMASFYGRSFLIIEGHWKPHDANGFLMTSYNGCGYGYYRNGQMVLYSKLYRYLMSVSMSGVIVLYSRDLFHTAYNICETFHYFQKPWAKHTALLDLHTIALPALEGEPELVRRWAACIEGVGVEFSREAQRLFKIPRRLALAVEEEWMQIRGIGAKTATDIVKQITGSREKKRTL